MGLVLEFLKESVSLWLEISIYLLLGMAIAGLLHVFLGKDLISRHLGKGGIAAVIKATVLGVPLPVCSCGVIPLASSLRKRPSSFEPDVQINIPDIHCAHCRITLEQGRYRGR